MADLSWIEACAPQNVRVRGFLARLCLWAEERSDIRAVVVVGSFARGEARPDSDLDVLLLAQNPSAYLEDSSWLYALGNVLDVGVERYGRVTSLRAHFDCGLEVELGIAPADWASEPHDAGTKQAALGGIRVLIDQDGEVTALAAAHFGDLDVAGT